MAKDYRRIAASKCCWARTRASSGQICGVFFPQYPGSAEGERGRCPKLVATKDASDGSWTVTGLGQEVRGSLESPSPAEALELLRKLKASRQAGA